MAEKRNLEDVLADLKEAEKEFNEKCLKYGIIEKYKKKKNEEVAQNSEIEEENTENTENTSSDNEEISEN